MTSEYPYYQQLQESGTRILGIWDDHDYGINDGDKHFPLKNHTRRIFLDFIAEPQDSVRRTDSFSPIHQDYIIDHRGFQTHILLIDNRFEFDSQTKDRLGDQQWSWLD